MKIRSLAMQNFRKFRAPMRLDGLTDGLNLISEPNEFGKSTILEAMRAALFERHGSKSEFIRSLRPWGDETAPTVELTFEVGGDLWRVEKRFIQTPRVTLTGPGGQTFTSDDAEDRLQRLLGFERAGNRGADEETRGVLGLLWIEQGAALALAAPGRVARATIEQVLAGQVGAMTGGRRAAAVMASVDQALAELRTLKTGQATGRLAEAQRAVEAATRLRASCELTLERFGETLDRLKGLRTELRLIEREAGDPQQATDIETWKKDLATAQAAEGRLREANARLGEARIRLERQQMQLDARSALRDRSIKAQAALVEAETARAEQVPAFDRAKTAEAAFASALTAAREALEALETKAAAARGRETAAARLRSLHAGFARLDAAESLVAEIARLEAAIAQSPITLDDLQTLADLDAAAATARAMLEAGAPILDIALLAPAAGGLTVDGRPATPGRSIVLRPMRIEIPGIGALTIAPAEAGGVAAERSCQRAQEDLARALARLGVASLAQARADAARRRDLEADRAEVRLRLAGACPPDAGLGVGAGVGALRAALSAAQRPGEAPDKAATPAESAESLEASLATARADERGAAQAREAAGHALQLAELERQRLTGLATAAAIQGAAARDELAQAVETVSDEALAEEVRLARAAYARAAEAVEAAESAAAAFDLRELERRLVNAANRQRNLAEERTRLAGLIGGLEQTALSEGEKGPAAALEEARADEAGAQATLDRLTAEADSLSLLRKVLAEANREATQLYLEPVTRHIGPYVGRLLPGATLELNDEMGAGWVSRAGRAEPALALSRGTQEQLAVLTRIAFADLLKDKGRPASLVLDDALVFSDDGRLEVMTEIISETARRMQVIMLTCRKRAFLHLDANRVSLSGSQAELG